MGVSKDLEFHVVRIDHKFLKVAFAIAKTGNRFLARLIVKIDEVVFAEGWAHAASTATGSGFDHDWEANLFG